RVAVLRHHDRRVRLRLARGGGILGDPRPEGCREGCWRGGRRSQGCGRQRVIPVLISEGSAVTITVVGQADKGPGGIPRWALSRVKRMPRDVAVCPGLPTAATAQVDDTGSREVRRR